LFVSTILIKPTLDGQDPSKNLYKTPQIIRNTNPYNTPPPQNPLGFQEGINQLELPLSTVQGAWSAGSFAEV
jgi:hypothetical protein